MIDMLDEDLRTVQIKSLLRPFYSKSERIHIPYENNEGSSGGLHSLLPWLECISISSANQQSIPKIKCYILLGGKRGCTCSIPVQY